MKRLALILMVLPAWVGCASQKELTLQSILTKVRGTNEKMLVRDMLISPDPDVRRSSVEKLSSRKHGCEEPYLKGYATLTKDPNPLVRGAALRALGKGGDLKYIDEVVAALSDNHATVRWDAAAALDSMRSEKAVTKLAYAGLNDPSTDVRVACLKALRNYRRTDVVETLLLGLGDGEFAVRFRAAESLNELTGEALGTDLAEWREALGRRSELFGEKAQPKRSWWARRFGRKVAPAPTTRPATTGDKRPWWDWFKVTKPKGPTATTQPAG